MRACLRAVASPHGTRDRIGLVRSLPAAGSGRLRLWGGAIRDN
jgi:hypothetical protein